MPARTRYSDQFKALLRWALRMAKEGHVDALLLLVDAPMEWAKIREATGKHAMLVAACSDEQLRAGTEAGFTTVKLPVSGAPVYERITQAVLEAVADDLLAPGATVAALYSGFELHAIDTMSVIHLDEHLGRLTVSDLRQLETRVPLDTLKMVVDLAVEIGREGREGKAVGTMFVVGDHRKVLKHCHPVGFDPVKGYNRKERNLDDTRVREGLKEISQMDGAFVIASDGTVEAAVQYISAPAADVTLSKGLGTRHWAAAAISRATNAVAVTVSESNGTVRVFQNGEVVLRVEPFRRAMKWKDFEYEPPTGGE